MTHALSELFKNFYPLPEADLNRLELRRVELNPDDTLFQAGEQYRKAVFLLVDGLAREQYSEKESRQHGPGAWVGLASYLDGQAYRSTLAAKTRTVFLAVTVSGPRQLEAEIPELFYLFNRIIAERMKERGAAPASLPGGLDLPAREVMKTPLATCPARLSVREAVAELRARQIGSLGVMDEQGRLLGLLTYPGVSEALILREVSPDDPAGRATTSPTRVITPETPLWRVEDLQQRHALKYLVVMDGEQPVGMVSQTDLLAGLVRGQGGLLPVIRRIEDRRGLRDCFQQLTGAARQAREQHRLASAAVAVLSDTHLALQRRCAELVSREMRDEGLGDPPLGFALLLMGSGGRREMLLNPDQDNGLILAQDPDQAAARWFETFAERFNQSLDEIGYPLCPGEIMARNPMFRKSLAQWKRQLEHITEQPTPRAARWANIVFDFVTLRGDAELTEQLRAHLLDCLRRRPRLLRMMAEDDAEGQAPIGWFNRLITDSDPGHRGMIDLKRNGLRIISDAARIFALGNGLGMGSTDERLAALRRRGRLDPDLADSARAAHEGLLDLLLSHQIGQAESGGTLDKYIRPNELSSHGQETLRLAMLAVKRLQERLQTEFDMLIF